MSNSKTSILSILPLCLFKIYNTFVWFFFFDKKSRLDYKVVRLVFLVWLIKLSYGLKRGILKFFGQL